MTRRRFLGACVVAAAGAVAGGYELLGGDKGPHHSREALTSAVAAAFPDRRAAAAVGHAYLQSNPRESSERQLLRAIRASDAGWARARTPSEVRALTRVQVRRDFAARRLATVDGWYLALTEARLCALSTFA